MTEEVTGIDLVQSQIKIAAGATLEELGLTQDKISVSGYAPPPPSSPPHPLP